jgi:hypothetical protein
VTFAVGDAVKKGRNMELSELVVTHYVDMLVGLSNQLNKASASGEGQFEPLLQQRLIDDMHPLSEQIRFACLQADEVVGRLLNTSWSQPGPIHSAQEAQGMIAASIARLHAVSRVDLDLRGQSGIILDLPGKLKFEMTGAEYVRDWAIPQFHFHVVMAYAIMRANGVSLGKADYVGHIFRYRSHDGSGAPVQ